jgi:hypothetical protein
MATPGQAVPGTVVASGVKTSPGGPQGTVGSIGPTGPQGPIGNTGSQGIPGNAATVAVGTTTTGAAGSNAAVTNSGSSAAAVFNFTVPQGIQGLQGNVGPQGSSAFTTVSGFTVPAVGATVQTTVADASWMAVGQMLYISTAGGATSAGALQVTAIAGNLVTLLNPAIVSAIPPADATQPGLLNTLSGNATDYVGGDNNCYSLSPVIWNARLRSYNSLGNPTFEVDQRNAGLRHY